ncbi:hypothetical protein QQ045_031046 [Rhodiola kirilowii]
MHRYFVVKKRFAYFEHGRRPQCSGHNRLMKSTSEIRVLMFLIRIRNSGDDNEQTRGLEDESFSFVFVNGRNCWIPKCPDQFKPYVGMTFPNLEKAILFYKEYARIAGFVVRLATTNSSDGIISIKYLVCQRQGFKPKSKVVDSINIADHNSRLRRDTRCGCLARIQLNGLVQRE